MNQNTNQEQLRQSQVQNMTKEELQRTQVLNLDDVREAVKYEKSVSKKPAFIFAIIGALLLCFGSTFIIVDNLRHKKTDDTIQHREVTSDKDRKLHESTLSCTYTELNRADATDTAYNIKFNFYDGKLINYLKTYTINLNALNQAPEVTLNNYIALLQPYVKDIKGYKTAMKQTTTGLVFTTDIDLEKLDLKSLPPEHTNLLVTAVDFDKEQTKTDIETKLSFQGYKCE